MTQRVVYDESGRAVPVVGLIDHMDAEARLARIAELASDITTSASNSWRNSHDDTIDEMAETAAEIKRLAEGGPDTTTEEETAR